MIQVAMNRGFPVMPLKLKPVPRVNNIEQHHAINITIKSSRYRSWLSLLYCPWVPKGRQDTWPLTPDLCLLSSANNRGNTWPFLDQSKAGLNYFSTDLKIAANKGSARKCVLVLLASG